MAHPSRALTVSGTTTVPLLLQLLLLLLQANVDRSMHRSAVVGVT
jgi:hypothetical protein